MSYRNRRFDGRKYWAGKPLCIICKTKKVKNGTICHGCQEEGHWTTKSISTDATKVLTEADLIQNYQVDELERSEASKLTRSIIGYLKDCAVTLLRSSTLTDISNTKDVEFLPISNELFDSVDGNFSIESADKKAFEFLFKMLSRQTEFELLLGFLYVKGKNKDKKDNIFAPLLYVKLECSKSEDNKNVIFTISDDTVVLNQALIVSMIDIKDEAELEVRFQDLYASIPSLPLTIGSLNQFLENLRNSFPDLPVDLKSFKNFKDLEKIENKENSLILIPSIAIILAPKQEAEGTIIDELHTMVGELLDNTGLDTLFSEAFRVQEELKSSQENNIKESFQETGDENLLEPFDLSDHQRKIVIGARTNPLTVISGPPGTGKSYTIRAIIADHLQRGKRILFVSRMEKAVDVIVTGLEETVGEFAIAKSGNRKAQMKLVGKLDRLTGPRTPIRQVTKTQLLELKNYYFQQKEAIEELEYEFVEMVNYEQDWADIKEQVLKIEKKIQKIDKEFHIKRINRNAHILTTPVEIIDRLKRWDKVFLTTWWGNTMLNQLKKLLNVPPETPVNDLIELLRATKNESDLRELESEMQKFEDINNLWLKIQKLRGELKDNALEYLRGILMGNLYQIINNHTKRMDLRNFMQSLRSANIRQKLALREKVNMETLLQAFPCWASTTSQLSQILPLKAGIFDLVIFDESSQCDLASAAPALYRGNRAVIVGDPKQLTHVVFMGKQAEMAAFANNSVPSAAQASYRFTTTNLYDVADSRVHQAHSYMLDEHFRSDPHIIGFSNTKFYDGNLRLMTQRPVISNKSNAIEVDYVHGRRTEGTVNPKEIEAVFKHVEKIIEQSSDFSPTTIGILCPFRDQVNAISKEVPKYLTLEQLDKHKIVVGTAHSLQGDEKDVVILSLSIDPHFHHMTLRFLETPNVFNVSITRAKKKVIVLSSVEISDLPNGLLKDFLIHAEHSIDKTLSIDNYDSRFEQDVAKALIDKGFSLWPHYESAGFEIDLVVGDGKNFIAIECDGPTHYDLKERAPYEDISREKILSRAGWTFVRISYREWDRNPEFSLQRIASTLASLAV